MATLNATVAPVPKNNSASEYTHLTAELGLSVRLTRSCAHFSIKELIAMGEAGRAKIRNYGRKCEREFCAFLESEPNLARPEQELADPLKPIYDALECAERTSEPLRDIKPRHWEAITSLVSAELSTRPVRSVALDLGLPWPKSAKRNEIWCSVPISAYLGASLREIRRRKTHGRVKLCTIVKVVAYAARKSLVKGPNADGEAQAVLDHNIFQGLDRRERFVLENRLCRGELTGMMTLEDIADKFHLTRERIRQIEKIIIDAIQASSLKTVVSSIEQNLLAKLREGYTYITDDLKSLAERIGPLEWLSIHIGQTTFSTWLDINFTRKQHGWYLRDKGDFSKLENAFSKFDFRCLPLPVGLLTELLKLSIDSILAYVELTGVAEIKNNYLIAKGDGKARSIRGVLLHRYLTSEPGGVNKLSEVGRNLNLCSSTTEYRSLRDAAINTKSLLVSNGYYVSARSFKDDGIVIEAPSPFTGDGIVNDDETGVGSTSDAVYQFVERNWPVELRTAVERFKLLNSDIELTDTSVQVMMSVDPRVKRLSPRVYAPVSADLAAEPDRVLRARRYALSETTVRAYCLAKESGENVSKLFFLWDHTQEQLWYQWLSKRASKELMAALVCVSEQPRWPIQNQSERLDVKEAKIDACFDLKPGWIANRSYKCPLFEDVLLCGKYALTNGSISWIMANYIAGGSFVASEYGANIIVILSALGVLDPRSNHWRRKICLCKEASVRVGELENVFVACHGVGCWEDDFIKKQILSALARAESRQLGFVRADTLRLISQNSADTVICEGAESLDA